MNQLERQLHDLFVGKLPALSAGGKEMTAKILPWLMIVFGVLGLFAWIASLQLLFGVFGLAQQAGALYSFMFLLHLIIAPVSIGLSIFGGYFMLSRRRQGWNLAFLSLLIGFVSTLLSLSLVGLVINCVFGYFLFQIREYYAAV